MICYDRSRDFLLLIFLLFLYFCWFQREKYYYYLPKTYLSVSCLSLFVYKYTHTQLLFLLFFFSSRFFLFTHYAFSSKSRVFVFRRFEFPNSNINKTDPFKHLIQTKVTSTFLSWKEYKLCFSQFAIICTRLCYIHITEV